MGIHLPSDSSSDVNNVQLFVCQKVMNINN